MYNALYVKPLRNLEIKNLPKKWPWLPFSQARIISDKNIWMLSPLQFHFQSIFGYELKTVENSHLQQLNCQRISCNSNRLRQGCVWNWGDQLTIALKNRIQIFLLIQFMKILGKYLYISNAKFTMKGCPEEIVVF